MTGVRETAPESDVVRKRADNRHLNDRPVTPRSVDDEERLSVLSPKNPPARPELAWPIFC